MPRGVSQKNIISGASGEWSEEMDARADQQGYDSAFRELTNMIVLPTGVLDRRIGTQIRGDVKFPLKKTRLIGYNFSVTTRFVLEIGDFYMRFWSNGVQVASGGNPVEIVTPWGENDLFEIHYRQINDIVYLTHPDHPQQKLSRITDTNWTILAVPFDEPAFLDLNISSTVLTPSVTTGSGILTSSAALFDPDHVGAFWKLTHPRAAGSLNRSLSSSGATVTLLTEGTWNLRTTGTWTGTLRLQEFNAATGNFDNVRELTSKDDSNFDIEDDQLLERLFRLDYTRISGTGEAYFELQDTTRDGIIKVTGFNSPTSVNMTVVKNLESTNATDVWREGAWSTFQGFPRTLAIFEQRILYAGTKKRPQTVWGSRTADYEDFERGPNDDDAIEYTFASQEQNRIEWMSGQIKLLIGTAGGEWTLSGEGDKPVTPSNVIVLRQSTYGSKHLQAIMVNDAVLYTQRNGLRVRQMIESETSVTAKYISPDLTIRAEHITEGGIIQSGYAQQPFSIFWNVNGIGELIGMTYERDQQITGWHRTKSDGASGLIESFATIYGDTPRGDEMWFVIKRVINGVEKRFIERLNPVDWKEKEDAFYVDSGETIVLPTHSSGNLSANKFYRIIDNSGGMDMTAVGGPVAPEVFETFEATITATPDYGTGSVREVAGTFVNAIPHLAGEIVQALGDGGVFEEITVGATGTITLPDKEKVTKVHIGLQYDSIVQPMKLDADPQLGAFMAIEVRLRAVTLRFIESLGVTYSTNLKEDDNVTLQERRVPLRDTKDVQDESPPLRTEDVTFTVQSGHDFDGNLTIFQKQPLPMKIAAMIKKYQVTGR